MFATNVLNVKTLHLRSFITASFANLRTTIAAALRAASDKLSPQGPSEVRMLLQEIDELERDEESARAQLMQLRVAYQSIKRRMGYMVSSFIAEEVIEKLERDPSLIPAFRRVVAEELISSALKGCFRLKNNGKMLAMIFEPPRPGQPCAAQAAIFECDERPERLRIKIAPAATTPKQTQLTYPDGAR